MREPARAVSQAAMAAIAAEMEELDAEAGRLDRAWEVRVCCRVLVTRGGGGKRGAGSGLGGEACDCCCAAWVWVGGLVSGRAGEVGWCRLG